MGYRNEAPIVVLKALNFAYNEYGRPVSTREVRETGKLLFAGPWTSVVGRSGGWSVWDFGDRVGRWLRALVRSGLAIEESEGTKVFFSPVDPKDLSDFLDEYRKTRREYGDVREEIKCFEGDRYPDYGQYLKERGIDIDTWPEEERRLSTILERLGEGSAESLENKRWRELKETEESCEMEFRYLGHQIGGDLDG